MIIKFKYYPLRAKIAAVTTVLAVFFLIYPVFFVRAVADRDPEIELALALSLLADTLLAARAYRNLGYVYEEISAFDPAAYNISYPQNLFDALGDTTRTDLCRVNLLIRQYFCIELT